jgi:hypothetical protein
MKTQNGTLIGRVGELKIDDAVPKMGLARQYLKDRAFLKVEYFSCAPRTQGLHNILFDGISVSFWYK